MPRLKRTGMPLKQQHHYFKWRNFFWLHFSYQIQEHEVVMKEVPLSKSSFSTADQHDNASPQNHRLEQTLRNQRHMHT